uniref:Lipase n=1 Tax=Periophthalmus magnuspinnatus TaxID=409849 RepID=A0A3B4BBB6_9GOBI
RLKCKTPFLKCYYSHVVRLSQSEIIGRWGFPSEEHEVQTEDGYILTLNRIPHSTGGRTGVVLLQHGLLAAGSNWITNPPDSALGFFLSQSGFDVWLSNSRGNTWSRKHASLDPKQNEYWAFRYVKQTHPKPHATITKHKPDQSRTSIGLSGVTIERFMAFSSLPSIAAKVKLFVALAPVATVMFTQSPMTKLSILPEFVTWEVFGRRAFLPQSHYIEWFAEHVCTKHSALCGNLFFVLCGFNEYNLNMTRTPVYTTHCPAGTSVQNMVHWAQAVKGGKLSAFDYGDKENMKHYNQSTPPDYDVRKMKVPTALFTGGHDTLADPKDVALLIPQISNLVFHLHLEEWEHLDFIWGLDAKDKMFPSILKLLQSY